MKSKVPLASLVDGKVIEAYRRHTGSESTDGKIANTLLRFWKQSKPCKTGTARQYGDWYLWVEYVCIRKIMKKGKS